jgi:hypothetical protein
LLFYRALHYRFRRAGTACLVIGLLSFGVQVLRAWLLWLLSFGVLFSVPGSYGYSGFGVLFSVPGSYVVTLKPRVSALKELDVGENFHSFGSTV